MKSQFGDFLRRKRKRKKLSVRTFAELIGKSSSYVSQLECGIRIAPKGELLHNMARVLSLSDAEREEFFDLAAITRDSVPEDLTDYINSHTTVKETIRLSKKCEIPEKEWSDFAKLIKEKFLF